MCLSVSPSTTKQFILTPSTWQPHPRRAGLSASILAPPLALQMPSPGPLTTLLRPINLFIGLRTGKHSTPSGPAYYAECSPGRLDGGDSCGRLCIRCALAPQSPLAPVLEPHPFEAFMEALHRHGCLDLW